MWLFSGWWNLLGRDFVLIFFRRDVHKIFFIVCLVRLSRITKLVLKAKIDEQLVFYLFARTRKKVSQPFFILLHDNKLSLLYAGIFETVCIIFEVMVTFLYQSNISSPCPALSNMKQTKIITNVKKKNDNNNNINRNENSKSFLFHCWPLYPNHTMMLKGTKKKAKIIEILSC